MHNTSMAERPEPAPGLMRLDVREYMDSTPGFWSAVSYANARLSGFVDDTEMSEMDEGREAHIVEKFNEKYFGLNWLERAVRFTIAYEDGPEGKQQLGVDTRDAKFIACTAETYEDDVLVDRDSAVFIRGMGRKALALRLKTDTEIFTIPIEKSILDLTVDISPPLANEKNTIGKLRNCSERFRNLLHSELFLRGELDDQKLQIEDCVSYFEEAVGITSFRNGKFELVIDATNNGKSALHLTGNHMWLVLPGAMEREEPFRSSDDYGYDELHVAIQQTDSETIHVVPVSQILDIIDHELPEGRALDSDILGKFFENPTIHQTLLAIENHINSFDDKDECVEAILEALQELHALVPDDFFDLRFDVKGYVFRDDDKEGMTVSERIEEHVDATLEDFGIQCVNGQFRIVLPFEAGDLEKEDSPSDVFYVVPDRLYISVLTGHENIEDRYVRDSEEGIDLVQAFEDCCNETEQLIRSNHFRKASRQEQCAMLENSMQSVNELIDRVSPQNDNEIVECFTSTYRVISREEGDLSCAEIARLPQAIMPKYSYERSLVVRGNRMLVVVPETVDHTIREFHNPFSFPLSKGRPMLLMEDSEGSATYYIPLDAISSLIPGVRNEHGE